MNVNVIMKTRVAFLNVESNITVEEDRNITKISMRLVSVGRRVFECSIFQNQNINMVFYYTIIHHLLT